MDACPPGPRTGPRWPAEIVIAPKGILNILYVLLALSMIVSLFGIVNTLVLSVFERTREIGMLRAVGMTRRQVRRMIRHESVITALIGSCSASRSACSCRRCTQARSTYRALVPGRLADRVFRSWIVGMLAAILPGPSRRPAEAARGAFVRVIRERRVARRLKSPGQPCTDPRRGESRRQEAGERASHPLTTPVWALLSTRTPGAKIAIARTRFKRSSLGLPDAPFPDR